MQNGSRIVFRCLSNKGQRFTNVQCFSLSSSQCSSKMTDISNSKVGFLGAGKMAQAICKGLVTSGTVHGKNITLSDRRGVSFPDHEKYGVSYVRSNIEMVKSSDVVILSVKPNVLLGVVEEVRNEIKGKLIVSVAAGMSTKSIEQAVQHQNARVIRMMPNIPCEVNEGVATVVRGVAVKDDDVEKLRTLVSCIFPVFEEIPEHLINTTTALAGSGPAFVYLIAEAMCDGAVKMGLPRDVAQKLSFQTLKGAATMLQHSNTSPAVLKDGVCSPGGTTIYGIDELEKNGVRNGLMRAIEASTKRGEELGKK